MNEVTQTRSNLSNSKRVAGAFPYWHETALLVLLVALMTTAHVLSPDFLDPGTQLELLTHVYEAGIIALPMTLIIITGGIDLSVGSTMALSAVTLGLAFRAGIPVFVAAILCVVVGTAAGALNGFFITRVKVHPLLVTLATLAAYSGIAEGVSKAAPVSGFPANFLALSSGGIDGVTIPGIIWIVSAVLTTVLVIRTPFGTYLYAMGYNEVASRLSGVPVQRIKYALYTLAGTASGLAAMLFVARRNTAKADVGNGMELDVIAMVVLGGTSIFGGRSTIIGTVLGVLLIHETREFVSWQTNRSELNSIFIGALLIIAVLLNRVFANQNSRTA